MQKSHWPHRLPVCCALVTLPAQLTLPHWLGWWAFICRLQVLHIVRHLPSYALLLPLRLGDWPSAIVNTQVLAFPVLFILLAFSPRPS